MKTIKTTVYNFEELSEAAQQKAISDNQDINFFDDWWGSVYDDAENIGLKITSFDLDRNRHAEGKFIDDAYTVASKIVAEHGEQCETYKIAKTFADFWEGAVKLHSDGIKTDIVKDGKENDFDYYVEEVEDNFLKNILEEYAVMLQTEYDYLSSEEAIKETIIANEYDFTEDGKRF